MRDPIDDLSVHARRGQLGDLGLRQLAILLRSSHEARLLHEAGCAFDKLDSVLPEDDVIARGVINRVLASRRRASRNHGRRYAQLALASIAWAAAAAAAAPLLVSSEVIRPTASLERVGFRQLANSVKSVAGQATTPAPESLAVRKATSDTVSAPSVGDVAGPERHEQPRAAREAGSSAQAFADANRMRRLGRTSEAILQYLSLQKNFPASIEARNADIALGLLRLQSNAPDAALVHFRRYLARNPSSQLLPEALFGVAQALDALGQQSAALQTYVSLLRRYPDSAYASTARAKLQNKR
jgi:TolA-binding protein